MPHRVVDFFRSPNDSIHTIKQTVQRHAHTSARAGATEKRHRPVRTTSYGSSGDSVVEDHVTAPAVTLLEPAKEKHKEHHRLSFHNLSLGGHKSQKDLTQNHNASLDWRIESSRPIMYGAPGESTGALVSGQLQLRVKEEGFEVENLEARLELCITQKKPYNSHCQGCASQKKELKTWSFLSEPTTLTQRTHEYPFSVLLEGHLPTTTDNALLSIQYVFTAETRPRDGGLPLKLRRTIHVQRSLPVPDEPHHSVRIFPPTTMTAKVDYDAVVYPQSTSSFTLRLNGVGRHNTSASSIEYWKLKRLSWRLEEDVKTVAPACQKHLPKGSDTDENENGAKKGTTRCDTRVISQADLTSGWKADYFSAQGAVEAEIEYSTGSTSPRPVSCDVRGGDGIEIKHRLVVELVVTQEYVTPTYTRHITPTGIARILRMNFNVIITDRSGLGVSWDNEAPPIYQDVPPSPPSYVHAMVRHGSVEDLSLSAVASDLDASSSEGEGCPTNRNSRGPSPTETTL
ncbi:hypothetical protein GGS21DRAFT_208844 [Xylaria nigripes]|nr:hypothetical protein GGS21DRAFT_208844 [Xylaria nigripes]